ncbi:bZIP transcription factor [Dactylonectria estremocensis]|uniref:BZIP transcription factor n=1 Tax=Dactylonectria estremocensis TaxID=1079267 RepID=A0A9P9IJV6_9HYPO|nr:bZIP transcription factor [Dactylonectria estremocensis]
MVRSSSAEPAKGTKRKGKPFSLSSCVHQQHPYPQTQGTRSVSTLTPSQLARKRANDREAQRAIRARTKEHIDRLERELEDLKSKQSRDQTVQELLRRNKALEDELSRLKENMGVSMTSSPYSTPGMCTSTSPTRARTRCRKPRRDFEPCVGATLALRRLLTRAPKTVYDDSLSTGSGAIPSPRASPFPSGDYGSLPDYSQQYVPLPNNCESWANTVPVPSNVSSPSSSANTDDYGAGYIPTSVPTSMLPSNNTSSSSISVVGGHKDIKMEYEDVDHHDAAFRLANQSMQGAPNPYMQQQQHQQQQHQHQQPAWNMYPAVYYPQAQSSVH